MESGLCGQWRWGWRAQEESKFTPIYILKSPEQQKDSSTFMKENKSQEDQLGEPCNVPKSWRPEMKQWL